LVRIVVPDCLGDPTVEACFGKHLTRWTDVRIHRDPPRSEDEFAARLADAECLLLHFEARRVTAHVLAGAPRLRVISIAGAGTGCVDLDTARARGIRIATTPQAAVPAVAEMTIAMMLALARDLAPLDARVREGEWPVTHGIDLDGKTLGILGLGAIGRRVAQIAQALGMQVLAWSPRDASTAEAGIERRPLAELMAQADVVSLHLRALPELAGVIDRAALECMKPGAIFVNTARALLVDEDALYALLRDGRIPGAGLDVFSSEPLTADHRWRDLPNVMLAPHTAWRTVDTLDRFIARAVANAQLANEG
jgi:phosphoglycerate dehydrogenase-like enzyme